MSAEKIRGIQCGVCALQLSGVTGCSKKKKCCKKHKTGKRCKSCPKRGE